MSKFIVLQPNGTPAERDRIILHESKDEACKFAIASPLYGWKRFKVAKYSTWKNSQDARIHRATMRVLTRMRRFK